MQSEWLIRLNESSELNQPLTNTINLKHFLHIHGI
jgi:hypothetical protein